MGDLRAGAAVPTDWERASRLKWFLPERTDEGKTMHETLVLAVALFVVLAGVPTLLWAVRWVLLRADRGGGGSRPTPPRPYRPSH